MCIWGFVVWLIGLSSSCCVMPWFFSLVVLGIFAKILVVELDIGLLEGLFGKLDLGFDVFASVKFDWGSWIIDFFICLSCLLKWELMDMEVLLSIFFYCRMCFWCAIYLEENHDFCDLVWREHFPCECTCVLLSSRIFSLWVYLFLFIKLYPLLHISHFVKLQLIGGCLLCLILPNSKWEIINASANVKFCSLWVKFGLKFHIY